MGKARRAITAVSQVVLDSYIDCIPDPILKYQLKALSFAVKVPYAFLKELLPDETDKFVKDVLSIKNIKKEVINSAEFQQALGSTLQNLIYVRQYSKRNIIKKVFKDAYISDDDYAKDHLEKITIYRRTNIDSGASASKIHKIRNYSDKGSVFGK